MQPCRGAAGHPGGAVATPSFDGSGRRPYRSCPNDRLEGGRREGVTTSERTAGEGVAVSADHWIGGERVASADRFEDVSPIDEQVIASVARGGAAEARAAVAAARDAFEGWARTTPKE